MDADDRRAQRITLLNQEFIELRSAAVERTRSLDTKASFLVVAAGILASATGLGLVRAETFFVGLVPFTLTLATVVAATIALWPRSLQQAGARELITLVDSSLDGPGLEDELLELRKEEVEHRNTQNEMKGLFTKCGFGLLLASLFFALYVVALDAVVPVLTHFVHHIVWSACV